MHKHASADGIIKLQLKGSRMMMMMMMMVKMMMMMMMMMQNLRLFNPKEDYFKAHKKHLRVIHVCINVIIAL